MFTLIQYVLVVIALSMTNNVLAEVSYPALYWYDEDKQVRLFEMGYSDAHQSPIYAHAPHDKAQKKVLTGRIIVVFDKQFESTLQKLLSDYPIHIVKKMNIGQYTYIFSVNEASKTQSLTLANRIYQQELVQAAYPDWLYLW